MTDLRKAAEAVLEAWGWDWSEPRNEALRERMEALRQALEQPDEVLAEREACAKLCDDLAETHEQMNQWGSYKTAESLAQAIRARSEK